MQWYSSAANIKFPGFTMFFNACTRVGLVPRLVQEGEHSISINLQVHLPLSSLGLLLANMYCGSDPTVMTVGGKSLWRYYFRSSEFSRFELHLCRETKSSQLRKVLILCIILLLLKGQFNVWGLVSRVSLSVARPVCSSVLNWIVTEEMVEQLAKTSIQLHVVFLGMESGRSRLMVRKLGSLRGQLDV